MPNFRHTLLGSSQSSTQNLVALAVVIHEILIRELRSNLAFFLTVSISKPCVAQMSDFRKVLLSSIETSTQNLDALAVVLREVLTHGKANKLYLYIHTHNNA